ncbi:YokU family protein [Anoxybacteroides amylolyticum]|uniref:YgiT-type zinc finger domain protein n=1 Tax=Anoxybacteroides amylolyticum TaxID=294699 RepID=A0A160F5T2_9BACL|nr:YokU family protein [Anoxybacillus amylolyticus]ANB61806.1 YgiT-type zinc finger domain protein [Anoxybacillus amylolyticus]
MICLWCGSNEGAETKQTVYWELPDGLRAIEITCTPSVSCHACGMIYQEEEIVTTIEDQLFLIDTIHLAKSITYDELMSQPRRLKRNYFR